MDYWIVESLLRVEQTTYPSIHQSTNPPIHQSIHPFSRRAAGLF
jgi:hypothetical protein